MARSRQAGAKGKVKGAAPPQQSGIGAFASQPFQGERRKVARMGGLFRNWSGRFFGGAIKEVCEHVERHRNEPATIKDLALTTPRFEIGLVGNISTELYHVLIMLTRGRAQRLVLKAAEPEGLEAYRFLLRRYEPTSTVTQPHSVVTSWML